ncbi:MAG TPA: hypothetical protein VIO57_04005 [Chloroflexota bacterium]|jgi:hypothetical protein
MNPDRGGRNPERQEKAHNFLRGRAEDQSMFSLDDFIAATGWKKSSVTTYISKQWKEYIEKPGGMLRVKRDFLRLSLTSFQHLATQSRKVFTDYQRLRYGELVIYEFLLPLTRQVELRRALDDLFYSDTIIRRLQEVGITKFEGAFPRREGEEESSFIDTIVQFASDHFGGYSISHVNGRFRAGKLVARQEASQLLADDELYLIDEITAVVRFIIPCSASKVEYENTFESIADFVDEGQQNDPSAEAITAELRRIRLLFRHLFVEAIVRTIQGEEAIWLLESGSSHRLYVWERRGK